MDWIAFVNIWEMKIGQEYRGFHNLPSIVLVMTLATLTVLSLARGSSGKSVHSWFVPPSVSVMSALREKITFVRAPRLKTYHDKRPNNVISHLSSPKAVITFSITVWSIQFRSVCPDQGYLGRQTNGYWKVWSYGTLWNGIAIKWTELNWTGPFWQGVRSNAPKVPFDCFKITNFLWHFRTVQEFLLSQEKSPPPMPRRSSSQLHSPPATDNLFLM